jgi:hypothetical protein
MVERCPKPARVSNPAVERLLGAVLAAVAYLAATETITDSGRPLSPWLGEIGIALALVPIAYLAYLLAQLAGAALGRLYLSTVTIGFGGRMRIVQEAGPRQQQLLPRGRGPHRPGHHHLGNHDRALAHAGNAIEAGVHSGFRMLRAKPSPPWPPSSTPPAGTTQGYLLPNRP